MRQSSFSDSGKASNDAWFGCCLRVRASQHVRRFWWLLPVLLAASQSPAVQRWEKFYGTPWSDYCNDARQTQDGGYIMTGSIAPSQTQGFLYLLKTDSAGDTLWSDAFPCATHTDTDAYGYAVVPTRDGGYFAAGGYWIQPGGVRVYAVKTDRMGETAWTRVIEPRPDSSGLPCHGFAFDAEQTHDGGYIMAGEADVSHESLAVGAKCTGAACDTPWVGNPLFVLRCDSMGNPLWCRQFGGKYLDVAYGVQETPDGGFIVAGFSRDSALDDFGLLLRLDGAGDSVWCRGYGTARTPQSWYFRTVRVLADGGLIMTGDWQTDYQINTSLLWLVRTDSVGETLWTRRYGDTTCSEWGLSMWLTSDGGCIIGGEIQQECREVLLVKVSAEGDTELTRIVPGEENADQVASSIQQTTDGGFIVGGTLEPGPYAGRTCSCTRRTSMAPRRLLTTERTDDRRNRFLSSECRGSSQDGCLASISSQSQEERESSSLMHWAND